MWNLFRRHYPPAALVLVATPLLAGDLALFILALAAAIALLPCAYGPEVDEIVERTFEPGRQQGRGTPRISDRE
jgi:hypothetical protein